MGLWIERVPTDDNFSDLPSRESYALITEMKAVRVASKLDKAFQTPSTWETVALDDQVRALEKERKYTTHIYTEIT